MTGIAWQSGQLTAQQARSHSDAVLPGATTGATGVSERLVVFSNDQYAEVAPGTTRIVRYYFQNVPAWVVTYSGVVLPQHGQPTTAANHELNVVINASSGAFMEMYSYQ